MTAPKKREHNEWNETLLASVIETRKGFAFKSAWYSDTGIPIVRVSNFTENSIDCSDLARVPETIAADYARYRLEKNDIIIQTVGSWPSNPASVVGKCIRTPTEAAGSLLNQNAVKIIPVNGIDNGFLYYILKSERFSQYIVGTAQGAASQAAITLDALRAYSFLCPPLETQRRIASILGAYDDLIEVNRRRVAVLEEMARGLFEEWFVRFRFPGHEAVPILDTPDGPLPEGWAMGVLGDVLRLEYGKALKADARIPGSIPVYGSSGEVGQHNAALVQGPGIIVGRKGNVGSVIWSRWDFWPIDTVFYVQSEYPLQYLFHQLKRLPFQNTDAAVPGLNRGGALKIPLVRPPLELCKEYDRLAEPPVALRDKLLEANMALQAARDLLLTRLISGQLSVESAERELEEVA